MKFSNAALVMALALGGAEVEGFSKASLPQSRVGTTLSSTWGNNSNYSNNPMDAYQRAMREMNNGFSYSNNDRGFPSNDRYLNDGKFQPQYDPNGQFMTQSASRNSNMPGTTRLGSTSVQSLVPDQDDTSRRTNSIFIPNQNPVQGSGGSFDRRFNDRTIYQPQNNRVGSYERPRSRSNSPRPRTNMFGQREEPDNSFYDRNRALPQGLGGYIPNLDQNNRRERYTSRTRNRNSNDSMSNNLWSDRISQRNEAISNRDPNFRRSRGIDMNNNFSNYNQNTKANYNGIIMEPDQSRGAGASNYNGNSNYSYNYNSYGSSNSNPFSTSSSLGINGRSSRSGSPRRINSVGLRPPENNGVPRNVINRQRYRTNARSGSLRADGAPRVTAVPIRPDTAGPRRSNSEPLLLEPSNPLNVDGYTASGTIGGQTIRGRDNRLIGDLNDRYSTPSCK